MKTSALVLIVEDQSVIRMLHRRQLDHCGIQCDAASNGADALRLFGENHYDLILMDVGLPGLNGVEVTKQIRKLEEQRNTGRTPIIGVTAEAERQVCIDAGMDEFFLKPLMLADVEQLTRRYCKGSGAAETF